MTQLNINLFAVIAAPVTSHIAVIPIKILPQKDLESLQNQNSDVNTPPHIYSIYSTFQTLLENFGIESYAHLSFFGFKQILMLSSFNTVSLFLYSLSLFAMNDYPSLGHNVPYEYNLID